MSVAIAAGLTVEEWHAMPDDGTDRELIRGKLKEQPKTHRNRFHARTVTRVAYALERWLEQTLKPRGKFIRAGAAASCDVIRTRSYRLIATARARTSEPRPEASRLTRRAILDSDDGRYLAADLSRPFRPG
jgi:hypothetical protein